MTIKDKKLEKADIKDKRLRNELVLTGLALASATWTHTPIHISSEKCARAIAKNPSELKSIQESGRFTVALHDGLLFGAMSPAPVDGCKSILTAGFNEEDTFEYSRNKKIIHDLDPRKMQFRYFKFLYEARMAMIQLVKKHEIKISPELMFNNMIVHSVDHYSYSEILKNVDFPLGGNGLGAYLNAMTFLWVWIMPIGSIFRDECISTSKKPFYKQLYEKCAAVDKDYADNIFYSTSY